MQGVFQEGAGKVGIRRDGRQKAQKKEKGLGGAEDDRGWVLWAWWRRGTFNGRGMRDGGREV